MKLNGTREHCGEVSSVRPDDLAPDSDFRARAQRRRDSAWARLVPRDEADSDDPDELASNASERLALVDELTFLVIQGTPNGTQPRLQRSVARVLKRRR